jgi:hypothetical protein
MSCALPPGGVLLRSRLQAWLCSLWLLSVEKRPLSLTRFTSLQVLIQTAAYAPEDIRVVQENGGGRNWPWQDDRAAQELIGVFAPLPIEFDISSLGASGGAIDGLSLQPGMEYKFDAAVSFQVPRPSKPPRPRHVPPCAPPYRTRR